MISPRTNFSVLANDAADGVTASLVAAETEDACNLGREGSAESAFDPFLALAIHVTSICYANDMYDQFRVCYRVHDAVVALPDTVQVLTGEFFAARRPRLHGQSGNTGNDLAADLVRKALQLFRGRALDQDAIACHAA